MRRLLLALSVAMLFAIGASLQAQVDTGWIAGTVTDASGAVVPNASVTAKSVATGAERTVQTNSSGQYTIPALIPGQYEVSVKAPNFGEF